MQSPLSSSAVYAENVGASASGPFTNKHAQAFPTRAEKKIKGVIRVQTFYCWQGKLSFLQVKDARQKTFFTRTLHVWRG